MCKFFSVITRGDGIPLFINLDERRKDPYNSDFDSHSYLAERYIKESELKNFDTQKGRCDIVNKYEVDFEFDDDFKITDYRLKIDTINIGDDSELLYKNIKKLLPEFNEIVKYHWWSKFVENPNIDGDLNLRDTPITKLPNNLKVGGFLSLRYTSITKLPENLKVGGRLDLSYSQITKLPDNLEVGGDLDLRGTKITELPNNLKVGGNLFLTGTPITKLPNNLQVSGWLDLSNTSITKLPNNLIVGGDLYLNKSNFNQETFVKPVGVIGNAYLFNF